MSLTIVYTTSRQEPEFQWFYDSLMRQKFSSVDRIIVVDSHSGLRPIHPMTDMATFAVKPGEPRDARDIFTRPKPTVWQGEGRLTKDNWWAVSNARNTGICLCQTYYIVWVDDRCVLQPGWLEGIMEAERGGYAVCGTYEKRRDMTVENGTILHGGTVMGQDSRFDYVKGIPNVPPKYQAAGARVFWPLT